MFDNSFYSSERQSISNNASVNKQSVFRTEAWTQAWLDTWGKYVSKELIDLGGQGHSTEMLYRIPHRFKHILPISAISLVGNGFGLLSTPRAEYNDIFNLVQASGNIDTLREELQRLNWQQLNLPDIASESQHDSDIRNLVSFQKWDSYVSKEEPSYSLEDIGFDDYLKSLSKSTRLAFFNRRARLANHGKIERLRHSIDNATHFFELLNGFHIYRWGKPCYSSQSIGFLINFCTRLENTGGEVVFETLLVDGKPVSVLFDVIWKNRRYNLQAGYDQYFSNKLALGSLHLGYAIEDAVKAGQIYDFLAGGGKKRNYKANVANRVTPLKSYIAVRGYWKSLRALQSNTRNWLRD